VTQRLRRQAAAAVQTPGVLLRAAMEYRWDIPAIVHRYVIALRRKYFPREALGLGLLNPAFRVETLDRLSSKGEMCRVQARLNPRSWEWVLSDKGIFFRFAAASGLPVPRLLGVFDRERGGWSFTGRVLRTEDAWADFFLRECPSDVVTKPGRSSYGKGVRVFRRQGDVLVDGEGVGWTPEALVGALKADPNPSHVIQERVFNHENLAVLSGGPGLQTVRVVTYVMRSGEPAVLAAFFRSVVGCNWIDNHVHGGTGNLMVDLDHHTGIMLKAQRQFPGRGFIEVTRHPDTGRVLAGERIPMWDEVLDLARRSARAVAPVRTVGWDIAVTPTGPVLLEGNFWYDPPTEGFRMNELFSALASDEPPGRTAG
jgi:hypothetical protein